MDPNRKILITLNNIFKYYHVTKKEYSENYLQFMRFYKYGVVIEREHG